MTENLSNVRSLKELGEALTGIPADQIPGDTNAAVISYIAENYSGGGGGEGRSGDAYLSGSKPAAIQGVDPGASTETLAEAINDIVAALSERGVTE